MLRRAACTSSGETAAKSRLYPVTAHSGNRMTSAPALADEWMISVMQETLSPMAARNFSCATATVSRFVFNIPRALIGLHDQEPITVAIGVVARWNEVRLAGIGKRRA